MWTPIEICLLGLKTVDLEKKDEKEIFVKEGACSLMMPAW